ncbi:MAG: ABC transporter ATP-binding protein [Candidatus Hodarchaeota archaeon]
MEKTNAYIIQTSGLSKTFKDVQAVKSLDLKVEKNSIFGFLGPNGAGKTTTMKILLGLIQPTAGTGRIFEHDILKDNIKIRNRIGYLPQDINFYKYMTAREILNFTMKFFFSGPKEVIKTRVEEMLDLVGLEEKADRATKTLSGGELQRLGIAQAQINSPELLILDEPAASLDPIGRKDMLEIMEKLREKCTIFYSTHILADVQRVSDHVAILNEGELVMQGSITDILSGNNDIVYEVTVKGDVATLEAKLYQIAWVSSIKTIHQNGTSRWEIQVSDKDAAERELLSTIYADGSVKVVDFGQKQMDLEDAFMSIIAGGEQ